MNDAELEAALHARAREHDLAFVVEQIEHGLWRAALKTTGSDPLTPAGDIRLSADHVDRHTALDALYLQGDPKR
jgi:hypothetical protein